MSFFKRLENGIRSVALGIGGGAIARSLNIGIGGPLGGVTSAVGGLTNRIGNNALSARNTYLPESTFKGSKSLSSDNYLFDEEFINDQSRMGVAELFKAEYGTDMLTKGQAGYDAQQQQVNALMLNKPNELKAIKSQAQMLTDQQRRGRLNNQTGGVRNGVARNPFNMNMMRGPLFFGDQKKAPSAPVFSGPSGSGSKNRSQISPRVEQRL